MPVQAQRGGGSMSIAHSQPDTIWWCVVSKMLRPLYSRERSRYTLCRTSLDGTENLAPIGIRSTDRPARSEPLYSLRCSGRPGSRQGS